MIKIRKEIIVMKHTFIEMVMIAVAVVKQGEVIDDEANVETKNIDCIYVNKDVIDAPSPVTQKKNGEKIKVKILVMFPMAVTSSVLNIMDSKMERAFF